MSKYLYSVKYRRADSVSRVHRMTVVAATADEAREYVRIRDVEFASTVESPRRGRELLEPDPIDIAKAWQEREDWTAHLDWHGHDIAVEVS